MYADVNLAKRGLAPNAFASRTSSDMTRHHFDTFIIRTTSMKSFAAIKTFDQNRRVHVKSLPNVVYARSCASASRAVDAVLTHGHALHHARYAVPKCTQTLTSVTQACRRVFVKLRHVMLKEIQCMDRICIKTSTNRTSRSRRM